MAEYIQKHTITASNNSYDKSHIMNTNRSDKHDSLLLGVDGGCHKASVSWNFDQYYFNGTRSNKHSKATQC